MRQVFKVAVTEESSVTKTIDIKVEGRYAATVQVIKPEPQCGRKGKVTIQASTSGPRSRESVEKFVAAVQRAITLAGIEESTFYKAPRSHHHSHNTE